MVGNKNNVRKKKKIMMCHATAHNVISHTKNSKS